MSFRYFHFGNRRASPSSMSCRGQLKSLKFFFTLQHCFLKARLSESHEMKSFSFSPLVYSKLWSEQSLKHRLGNFHPQKKLQLKFIFFVFGFFFRDKTRIKASEKCNTRNSRTNGSQRAASKKSKELFLCFFFPFNHCRPTFFFFGKQKDSNFLRVLLYILNFKPFLVFVFGGA